MFTDLLLIYRLNNESLFLITANKKYYINEISHTAAAGPDRFPAVLLKHCRNALARPLYLIWHKSLDCGIIPQLLKTANIVPIHKGKSRGDPANYRPVALTSHLIKLFEKILKKHIYASSESSQTV